mgnify:CR=1 FL=1
MRQARIVFMGGTLTQEGNCYDLVCETNMIQDPEAADRVLRSGADVTMVGLDVTHRCLLGSSDITPWNAAHTEASRFLTAIAEFSIRANAASEPIFAAGMPLHDRTGQRRNAAGYRVCAHHRRILAKLQDKTSW